MDRFGNVTKPIRKHGLQRYKTIQYHSYNTCPNVPLLSWQTSVLISNKSSVVLQITMKKDENKFDLLTGSVQPENITKVEQWQRHFATKSAKVPMCFTFCILCLATYVDLRIQNDFEVHFFCLPIHFPYFHVHDDATSCPICPIISIQFHPGQECEHQVFPGHHEPHIFSFEFATSKINKASSKSTFFRSNKK